MGEAVRDLISRGAFANSRKLRDESQAFIDGLPKKTVDSLMPQYADEACEIKALPGNRLLYHGYVFTYRDGSDAASALYGTEPFMPLRLVAAADPDIRPASGKEPEEAMDIRDVLSLLTFGNIDKALEKYPFLGDFEACLEDMFTLDCRDAYEQSTMPYINGEATDLSERLISLPDSSLSEFFDGTDDFVRFVLRVFDRLYTDASEVTIEDDPGDDEGYHLTLTINNNGYIGYLHLIRADTEAPVIEGFEVAKIYCHLGLGSKLLVAAVKMCSLKHAVKKIVVTPNPTDPDLSEKKLAGIYRRLGEDLRKECGIELEVNELS